jgi:hypothetical protein
MAAPQFFVPPRVRPSRPKRRFTLEQANKTLPLVTRIVADIVNVHKNVTAKHGEVERMPTGSKTRNEAERAMEKDLERLNLLVEELSQIGCELKDPQAGLIDFVGRHRGRDVYLCWKLGEADITSWHELDAGFAGRQPVSSLEESA